MHFPNIRWHTCVQRLNVFLSSFPREQQFFSLLGRGKWNAYGNCIQVNHLLQGHCTLMCHLILWHRHQCVTKYKAQTHQCVTWYVDTSTDTYCRHHDTPVTTDGRGEGGTLPTVAFNIFCPRDCVSRHNGGIAGAPLNPSETIVLSEHYRLWGV